MLEMIFENDRDAAMRLQGSVVSLDGSPVYVIEAGARTCSISNLGGGEERQVATADLNLTPVKVGNVQRGNSYIYLQRAPVRRWKQGLNNENIVTSHMPWEAGRINVNSVEMGNAIIGAYPNAIEAIRKVNEGATAIAISHRWGVGIVEDMVHLFYKDKVVGIVDGEELTVYGKFFYLREDLLGVLNG